MRRTDREVEGRDDLLAILGGADTCRLGFAVAGEPYIVAVNYGFEWTGEMPVLYFHCAREGRKLDAMRANPRVCFELDGEHELIRGERPCDWGMKYASIVGYGRLSEVVDGEARQAGLDSIMVRYGWKGEAAYAPAVFDRTTVLRLDVDELSGKRRG